MRRLGVEYGIYVPEKFEDSVWFKHMQQDIVAVAGGLTIVKAAGTYKVGLGSIKEGILIVSARATEFEYNEYTRINRAMHQFAQFMIGLGEKEVMRYRGDKVFMQHAVDKE